MWRELTQILSFSVEFSGAKGKPAMHRASSALIIFIFNVNYFQRHESGGFWVVQVRFTMSRTGSRDKVASPTGLDWAGFYFGSKQTFSLSLAQSPNSPIIVNWDVSYKILIWA